MALPEDGTDSEIIFGALDVIPKALYGHQRVVFDLASAIQAHVAADGGEVIADIDLMLNHMHTYVSPDLMYFTRPQMARINPNRRVTRPPTLVVEVLTVSSTTRDRVLKRQAYARVGIPHYWIVDPAARRIDELVLTSEGAYDETPPSSASTHFRPALFPGLAIDLTRLFR